MATNNSMLKGLSAEEKQAVLKEAHRAQIIVGLIKVILFLLITLAPFIF